MTKPKPFKTVLTEMMFFENHKLSSYEEGCNETAREAITELAKLIREIERIWAKLYASDISNDEFSAVTSFKDEVLALLKEPPTGHRGLEK